MVMLKGWRYVAFLGCITGGTLLALYPIVIDPYLNPEKFRKIQEETRKGIVQANIQPGNMKVWTDPFDRKKEK